MLETSEDNVADREWEEYDYDGHDDDDGDDHDHDDECDGYKDERDIHQ